jgi:iron complex outermembrane receptor protein
LKPESSINFSAGFATTPIDNLTFTSDFYYIAIDDRITITGFLGDGTGTDSIGHILTNIGSRATTAQYFTNAINTRTRGLDITGDYTVETMGGTAGLNAVFNFTRTTIPNEDNIPIPPELKGTGATLVNKYDEGGLLAITKERPAWRSTVTGQYRRGWWNGMARYSYYGKYSSSLYSYSGADVQNYDGKGLVDAELGFTPVQGFKISVGGRNLFDVYPDRMSENNGFDIFPWPPASPFGYNGRYVYTRVELTGR